MKRFSFFPVLLFSILFLLSLRSLYLLLGAGLEGTHPVLNRLLYFGIYDILGGGLFLFLLPWLRYQKVSDFSDWNLLPFPLVSRKNSLFSFLLSILGGGAFYLLLLIVLHSTGNLDSGFRPGGFLTDRLENDASFFWQFFLTSVLLTPVSEEFFFRYILPAGLVRSGMTEGAALFFLALAFASVHPPAAAPFLFLFGLFLGILARNRGLPGPILAHATYNALILLHARFGLPG